MRAAGPELTLGADVMVGFPGETDAEFEETLALVRALPFGYLHLFPFSPRPGRGPGRSMPSGRFRHRLSRSAWRLCALWPRKRPKLTGDRFHGRQLEAITLHTPAELAGAGPEPPALTENFLPDGD